MKELKNATFALVGSVASMPLQLLGGILVARSLGPELFGNYSFAVTFSYFFSCFADGGLSILATRELARQTDKTKVYLTSIFLLKAFLTVLFFGLMMVAALFWKVDNHLLLLFIVVGVGNFISSLSFLLVGIARAYEKMQIEGIMNFMQSISFVAFILIALILNKANNIFAVSFSFMGSYVLSSSVGVLSLRKYLLVDTHVDFHLIRSLAKEALSIAVGWIILLTYTRIGVVVLEAGANPTEVGYFNAALRLSLNLGVFPYILAGAWMPMLARSAYGDRKAYVQGAMTLMKYLWIGGLLFAVPLGLTAKEVVNFFYGSAFDAASLPFTLLMVAMFFFFISFGPKTFMESADRQRGWGIAACAGLVVNVTVTAWLAPTLGATGASLGLLVANMIIALLSFGFCSSMVPWRTMAGKIFRISIGGLLMALLTWYVCPLSWVIAGVAGGVLFLVYLLLIGEIRWSEINKVLSVKTQED